MFDTHSTATPLSRFGTVALLGWVNAGKSTLLNALLEDRLSITTPKMHTTRKPIAGILHRPEGQIVLRDLPGLTHKNNFFTQELVKTSRAYAADSQVILWVVDGSRHDKLQHDKMQEWLRHMPHKPLVIALNKIDLCRSKTALFPVLQAYHQLFPQSDIVPISAKKRQGLDALNQVLFQKLPEAQLPFQTDAYTLQSERMLCEELIFEQVLLQLQQEVPYETAVHIQRFEDLRHQRPARCSLLADIWVTRESQKALVLGKQGQKIREMGTRARQRIEKLLGCAVYLELYVQVKPGWQNSRALLRELGFSAEVTSWTTQNHVL